MDKSEDRVSPTKLRLFRRKKAGAGGTSAGAQAEAEAPLGESSGLSFMLGFMRRDRPTLVALVGIAIFVLWSIIEGGLQLAAGYGRGHASLGWLLLPSNPFPINFGLSLGAPTLAHFPVGIFGYNYQGESILSEILYAAPRDAMAAILVVASAIVVGMLLGITAGYVGGWADEILMRITDAFLAFPALILAIALSLILGSGFTVVLITLVIIWWPTYARFFRAQSLSLKARGYVEASKLSGLSSFRIMMRHIFPNSVDPIIAIATLDFGNVILTYSVLAFLGIGVQVGIPEWGSMASFGLAYLPHVWWYAFFPGLVIMIVVVLFSIVGDRLQDLVGGRLSY
jgi:peptide/nickel transport system permease protein